MKNLLIAALLLQGFIAKSQMPAFTVVDPSFLQLTDTMKGVDKIAGGFGFLEGPLWSKENALLFSDLSVNKIFKLKEDHSVELYLDHSGFTGEHGANMSRDYGSDALAYAKNGDLIICQHGNHALTILKKDKSRQVLVNTYQHKRLNSPDDLCVKSDGSVYFTDPPYVFPRLDDDTAKRQKDNGIYRYKNGTLDLLSTDYRFPNGITFSPDEKYLYICSYGKDEPVRRYEVADDGTLRNGKVLFTENGDGLKTDSAGNLYLCNAKGIEVLSPEGVLLGIIHCPEGVTNINWGGKDWKILYIVAQTSVYMLKMKMPGKKSW